MIPAYPLQWPAGWKRTNPRHTKSGRFTKGERMHSSDGASSYVQRRPLTITAAVERVLRELERMGIDMQDVVVSTNVRTRLDGLPRAGERRPEDAGAAVYWHDRHAARDKAPRVMAIDLYTDVADNLAAIAATLEAMRAIERHGGAAILERAFTGFAALPAPGQTGGRHWREVLDLPRAGDVYEADVAQAYRRLAAQRHPDRAGGDDTAMAELNAARAQALAAIGARA